MKTRPETTEIGFGTWTDEDLLTEYRLTGNRELFEVLVKRYETELFHYLYNRTGNRETAEDVFQATFLQVHLKSDSFEEGRAFRPWLYRIAVNQAIDLHRKNRRHEAARLDETSSADGDGDPLSAILESPLPTPDDEFGVGEDRALLRRAVDNLSPIQRDVVRMVYFRGMTYRQAARELDIPFKTVATRLYAAKKQLASALTGKTSAF